MFRWLFGVVLVFVFPVTVMAQPELNECLLSKMATADDSVTLGDIRKLCQAEVRLQVRDDVQAQIIDEAAFTSNKTDEEVTVDQDNVLETEDGSALTRRLVLEKSQSNNPFAFLPHRPNYFIFSNNMASSNQAPFDAADPNRGYDFQPWESKFQISLKLPVARGILGGRADAFIAYTNRSFWQMFNREGSEPFRDSNHEPEAWLSFNNDFELFGFKNSLNNIGISHQSNGQSGALSRSWNRVYAEFLFEKDNLYFSVKPWWRLPEDSENDDNPDITKFMGNFEFTSVYKYGDHNFDVMIRNNLRSDNKGAVQLGWTFPVYKNFRGYLQWFNGYGESLIDYDHRTNSIGIGIKFSDWL